VLFDELNVRDVLDQLGVIVLAVAPDGRILYGNEAALFAYGYSLEELTGLHISAIRGPSDLDAVPQQLHDAVEAGAVFETVHRRSDGRTFPVEVSSRPMTRASGTVLISLVTDISGRKAAMQALRDDEQRFRLLAENSADIVMRIVIGGVIEWVSPSVSAVLGWSPQELMGRRIVELVHPEDHVKFSAGRARIASDGEAVFRYRILRSDDSYQWVESHAKPYVNAEGEREGVITIIRVVDAQIRAEREFERLARYDELTGVLVRQELMERLEVAVLDATQVAEHVAIIFCHVDHLAQINEACGRDGGNVALRAVADRVKSCVRRSDLIGRMGSDEFIVALSDVQREAHALNVAEKIRAAVAEPVEIGDCVCMPTVSVAVTLVDPNEDVDTAIGRASRALGDAEAPARDRVVRA
jgi:diguanylate cyclase (GGDEF)-like protein/PAS domain S-box-containing protein